MKKKPPISPNDNPPIDYVCDREECIVDDLPEECRVIPPLSRRKIKQPRAAKPYSEPTLSTPTLPAKLYIPKKGRKK